MMQELSVWLACERAADATPERVLLFGAGGRCQNYLRERLYRGVQELTRRRVVGLVDDDPNLRRRWIAGYQVLGNRLELAGLIREHGIHRVVISAVVPESTRAAVEKITRKAAIALSEWVQGEFEVRQARERYDDAEMCELEMLKR
jgi:FlaA1/EpsC-like NDP-sugar epimerase